MVEVHQQKEEEGDLSSAPFPQIINQGYLYTKAGESVLTNADLNLSFSKVLDSYIDTKRLLDQESLSRAEIDQIKYKLDHKQNTILHMLRTDPQAKGKMKMIAGDRILKEEYKPFSEVVDVNNVKRSAEEAELGEGNGEKLKVTKNEGAEAGENSPEAGEKSPPAVSLPNPAQPSAQPSAQATAQPTTEPPSEQKPAVPSPVVSVADAPSVKPPVVAPSSKPTAKKISFSGYQKKIKTQQSETSPTSPVSVAPPEHLHAAVNKNGAIVYNFEGNQGEQFHNISPYINPNKNLKSCLKPAKSNKRRPKTVTFPVENLVSERSSNLNSYKAMERKEGSLLHKYNDGISVQAIDVNPWKQPVEVLDLSSLAEIEDVSIIKGGSTPLLLSDEIFHKCAFPPTGNFDGSPTEHPGLITHDLVTDIDDLKPFAGVPGRGENNDSGNDTNDNINDNGNSNSGNNEDDDDEDDYFSSIKEAEGSSDDSDGSVDQILVKH